MIIRPQPGPQEAFLRTGADIAIYGGAAGGGKTWALLVEALRHIHNADFRAVLFRRTYPQIINPGGLHDEALKLYPLLGGVATQPSSGVTWTFPSGARVRFAHLQHEKTVYDWQGAQIPLIGFDELTHFTERQFWYLLSRNRSLSGVRPYIRATTNPEPGWVAELIGWWIGEDGFAIPERAGVVRHFVRYGGEIVWADDAETLRRRYRDAVPKSLTFIPARLEDNRVLMERDPGYMANLLALPLVERERLLRGNWLIQPSGGKVFNRAWFEIVPAQMVAEEGEECRFWDFAATAKKLAGDDPDYTAGVLLRKTGDTYTVVDVVVGQWGPAEVERVLLRTTRRDAERAKRSGGKLRYKVRWEIEPGSAGKRENRRLIKLLDGLDAKGVRPQGDKLTRAKPLAVQAEAGFVRVVRAEWTERFINHLHHQPDWPHDDMMDAVSGAYAELVKTGIGSARVDFYAETAGEDETPELVRSEDEIERLLDEYEAGEL